MQFKTRADSLTPLYPRVMQGNAQLLGMKGASKETNIWKIRLQLMKPVTWIPLIWGACAALSSGQLASWGVERY